MIEKDMVIADVIPKIFHEYMRIGYVPLEIYNQIMSAAKQQVREIKI